jgi:hypothetical protein
MRLSALLQAPLFYPIVPLYVKGVSARGCSEVGERTLEQPPTFEQGIEALSQPGLKETGQDHAGLAALLAAGAAADLATDHQRAQAALGQIIVGRYARLADKTVKSEHLRWRDKVMAGDFLRESSVKNRQRGVSSWMVVES